MELIVWHEYINVAEELSKYDGEAFIRSAISRYYYAVFGMARYYLIFVLGERKFKTKHYTHSKVIDRFIKSKNPIDNSIGNSLKILRHDRNQADYAIDENISDYDIDEISTLAKDSIALINYLIDNS